MQMLKRCGVALCLAALVSGCSVIDLGEPSPSTAHANECQRNRSKCMYEGSYEPGERQYAEEEARRLNQAALEKLRRSGVR